MRIGGEQARCIHVFVHEVPYQNYSLRQPGMGSYHNKKCEFILQCSIKIGFILACSLYLSKESEIVVIWTLVTLGNVDSLVNNNGYISIFFLPF